MATTEAVAAPKVKRLTRKIKTSKRIPLSKQQVLDLIRLLETETGFYPNLQWSSRGKAAAGAKWCYRRKPTLRVSKEPSLLEVVEEYTHAYLEFKVLKSLVDHPHPPEFKALFREVLGAYDPNLLAELEAE